MVFPLRGADGTYRPFLTLVAPLRGDDGAILQWFGTNTDVTHPRQLEVELRKLAADLAEADRRKNEFLAVLAHELRNPLAPIRTALELMRMGGSDADELASMRDMMQRQIQQMVHLIDDLLDVSRISSGKIVLRKEQLDLSEVVSTRLGGQPAVDLPGPARVDGRAPGRTIAGRGRPNAAGPSALELAGQLRQVHARGRPHLARGDPRRRSSGAPRPRLGPGHSRRDVALDLRHVHPGRPHAGPRQGGLGIGLALVRSLVEMHGGRVDAQSAGDGQGSEFVVRLPLAEPPRAASPPAPPVASEAGNGAPARGCEFWSSTTIRMPPRCWPGYSRPAGTKCRLPTTGRRPSKPATALCRKSSCSTSGCRE